MNLQINRNTLNSPIKNIPLRGVYYNFLFVFIALILLSITSTSNIKAELLFEDDFSSGNFTNHNDYFRWGRDGLILQAGDAMAVPIEPVLGPNGIDYVNAMTFTYGTWQEQRFHLTTSISEVRSASGLSNTSYPEVWISYDMLVPANYTNNSTGGEGGHNNKGFLTLWKGRYDGDSELFSLFSFWPGDARGGTAGQSLLSLTPAGHIFGTSAYDPAHKRLDHPGFNGEDAVYAFIPSDYGKWRNYTMRLVANTNGIADGIAELYKDGELIARFSGVNFQDYGNPLNGTTGFDRGYILGYHNSGYTESTVFRITNFKFGTSKEGVLGLASPKANPPSSFNATNH